MTPKEKAKELIDKFIPPTRDLDDVWGWEDCIESAKQCAIICVDEILNGFIKLLPYSRAYWEEVRKEIENI